MQIAPEITFEGSDSSDAARVLILGEIKRLEAHKQRITGCRVKVIAPSQVAQGQFDAFTSAWCDWFVQEKAPWKQESGVFPLTSLKLIG